LTKTGIKKIVISVVSVAVWLLLWELTALIIGYDFIFPGVIDTARAFLSLAGTAVYWKTVMLSIFRILLGLILGVIFGTALMLLCKLVPFISTFISIGMTVIKSTPVASIIMILWVVVGSTSLPVVIGLLMVMPLIWQNLMNGYEAIDPALCEVSRVFGFSRMKHLKLIVLPTLYRYFVPAVLTSVGLAWKSGIAAEIIAYTKNSIGEGIFNAKTFFEGDVMLAWTLTVVIISLSLEYLVKLLTRRFLKNA